MDEQLVIARRYLSPPADAFWSWSDDGAVVVWKQGETIAFRQELNFVLAQLQPRGLPPMGAVVLLMAACRSSWQACSAQFASEISTLMNIERRILPEWPRQAFHLLDRIHAMPPDLRETLVAKAELARSVFEDAPHRTSPQDAAAIVEALECVPSLVLKTDGLFFPPPVEATLQSLRSLREGVARLDLNALRLRIRTGLEQLVAPSHAEIWPGQRVRTLISQLLSDEQLGGLARLARNLMAAVNLPRPIADREDLPLGGVSDIANRGPLDRLLISELAHDDLTLAVRIATNEAMYLRREAPPRTPPRRRAVLLDAGLRMWGVPRLFATSVALALAANTDRRTEVLAFRADGKQLAEVDLTTREGLVDQLGALTSEIHPGAALASFVEQMADGDHPTDFVLITAADVLADEHFQGCLAAVQLPAFFVATVTREGGFRLFSRSARGSKQVGQAQLQLDQILVPTRRATAPMLDERFDDSHPAILRVQPFPLLLPHAVDARRSWYVKDHGALAVTKDRRLMLWEKPAQGARQLSDKVPPGTVHWCQIGTRGNRTHAVVGNASGRSLYLFGVDLEGGECVCHPLDVDPVETVRSVCGHNAVLFVIYKRRVDVFAMETGQRTHSLSLPANLVRFRDRFFLSRNGQWYALSFDGLAPRLEPVCSARTPNGSLLVTLFDSEYGFGPVGVTDDGKLWFTDRQASKQPAHGLMAPVRVRVIARNGKRLVLAGRSAPGGWPNEQLVSVFVANGASRVIYGDPLANVERELWEFMRPITLRHRFTGIYTDGGSIHLVSRKRAHLRFSLFGRSGDSSSQGIQKSQQLCFTAVESSPRVQPIPFEPLSRHPEVAYSLRVASWLDGSRAVLDSRGLLHLKSSDPELPEMTLVLFEGATACWTSDGELCGNPYFTGGRENADVREVFLRVLSRFANSAQ